MKTFVAALGAIALAIAPLVSIAATPRATASADNCGHSPRGLRWRFQALAGMC